MNIWKTFKVILLRRMLRSFWKHNSHYADGCVDKNIWKMFGAIMKLSSSVRNTRSLGAVCLYVKRIYTQTDIDLFFRCLSGVMGQESNSRSWLWFRSRWKWMLSRAFNILVLENCQMGGIVRLHELMWKLLSGPLFTHTHLNHIGSL